MIKKILLSGLVIIGFIVYAFTKPQEQSQINTSTQTPIKSGQTSSQSGQTKNSGKYQDGTYVGDTINFLYGNMQVKIIVANGSLSDVQFLQYPNDRDTSVQINTETMPLLKNEAIQAQSAQVDIVTGATDSSEAFQKSLETALAQANN